MSSSLLAVIFKYIKKYVKICKNTPYKSKNMLKIEHGRSSKGCLLNNIHKDCLKSVFVHKLFNSTKSSSLQVTFYQGNIKITFK